MSKLLDVRVLKWITQYKWANASGIKASRISLDVIGSLDSQKIFGCPSVFHHNGKRIKKIYTAWNSPVLRLGLKGSSFMTSEEQLSEI